MKKIKFVQFPDNPRAITGTQMQLLHESMVELGSLDGIVVNLSPGKYQNAIISGNQKTKHIDLNKAEIIRDYSPSEPTKAGTVASGWVTYEGERYPFREVWWTDYQCQIANLRANNVGGRNDVDLLSQFDADVLDAAMINLHFEEGAEKLYNQFFAPDMNEMATGGNDDENKKKSASGKKKEEDEFSSFEISLPRVDKLNLVETLERVREQNNFETLAEALTHIVNTFNTLQDGSEG